MTIELKFPPNVIETHLDIKGVKVQIKKIDDDSYQIWINDKECKYDLHNVPSEYDYMNINMVHRQNRCEDGLGNWWCCGIWNVLHTGSIDNGGKYSFEFINIILEAIENGVNKLEEIYSKPEIIKVGNVTIEKKRINKDTICLSVDGLISAYQYPSEITSNGNTVYRVGDDEFTIYDINNDVVDIDYRCYFPIKDFKVSNEDADKIIRIITASEEKLANYYKEKIKVGDTIKFNEIFLGKVMAIDDKCAWLKINDSHNGFYYVTYELAGLTKVQE